MKGKHIGTGVLMEEKGPKQRTSETHMKWGREQEENILGQDWIRGGWNGVRTLF